MSQGGETCIPTNSYLILYPKFFINFIEISNRFLHSFEMFVSYICKAPNEKFA